MKRCVKNSDKVMSYIGDNNFDVAFIEGRGKKDEDSSDETYI